MKLAIIGSRSIESIDFNEYIKKKPEYIISGGAMGIDTLAWKWAVENGIEIIVHKPDYNKYGKLAALKRNDVIIKEADKIMAFLDGKSTGTKYVIDNAEKMNKLIEIIMIKENID